MLKAKKCKLCDNPAFSKGLCKNHMENSAIKKNNTPIKSKSKVIKFSRESTVEKKSIKSELRNIYFDYHLQRCTHSEFSNLPISEPTRSNICHLIPKSNHESIQDNLDNCIYLTFKEHERFDYLLFSHKFEQLDEEFKKISDLIWFRFKKVLSSCQENTNFTRELKKYLDGREET